jgi:hypothetical protein
MTTSLPGSVQAVFESFITTELTTVDSVGQPITWPVTPYYVPGGSCIDVTTGLGYPKKANDARANPLVALLFSDPTGSGRDDAPAVLVQGVADVDDRDLDANRARYGRESVAKLPSIKQMLPPEPLQRLFAWYFTRIYIHVRPERIYVWPDRDFTREPELYGSHVEEIRSGHSEEPDRFHADPGGGASSWHPRISQFGTKYPTAVLSIVCPDGFPFAVRLPVSADPANRWIRIEGEPVGIPLQPGLACLTAHAHSANFTWQQNFQVRGDLVRREDGWVLAPHKLIGGFELPPSRIAAVRANAGKAWRFRRTAKRELARRS